MLQLNHKKGGYMVTNTNLLKSKMLIVGDEDFIKALSSTLNISRTTASKKLNGKATFDQSEIATLAKKYMLSAEDIKEIFVGAE